MRQTSRLRACLLAVPLTDDRGTTRDPVSTSDKGGEACCVSWHGVRESPDATGELPPPTETVERTGGCNCCPFLSGEAGRRLVHSDWFALAGFIRTSVSDP
jgi:hypothetical protein